MEPMRLLVTDAAAQPPRQATAWLIMTLGRENHEISRTNLGGRRGVSPQADRIRNGTHSYTIQNRQKSLGGVWSYSCYRRSGLDDAMDLRAPRSNDEGGRLWSRVLVSRHFLSGAFSHSKFMQRPSRYCIAEPDRRETKRRKMSLTMRPAKTDACHGSCCACSAPSTRLASLER